MSFLDKARPVSTQNATSTVSFVSKVRPVEQVTNESTESVDNIPTKKEIGSYWSQKPNLNSVSNTIQNIFPGSKLGQAVGNSIYGIGQLVKGNKGGFNEAASANEKLMPQVAGDVGNAVLTAASPIITGPTALTRIGLNTALGAGLGGTKAISEGKNTSDTIKSSLLGGVIGGVASGIGEGISALIKYLPKSITHTILPKLDEKNIDYALENTKIGSVNKLYNNSKESLGELGNQITDILKQPQYADEIGKTTDAFGDLADSFTQSDYTKQELVKKIKDFVPGYSKIVQKVADGTANLYEQNLLRSAIDMANKTVYTSLNRPPEVKAIAQGLADILRTNVQETATETQPIFQDLSKEINLNKALQIATKKVGGIAHIGLKEILTFLGGTAASGGNPLVGVGATVGEKVLTSPGVGLGVAQGLNTVNKAIPFVSALGRGVRAPLINAFSNR